MCALNGIRRADSFNTHTNRLKDKARYRVGSFSELPARDKERCQDNELIPILCFYWVPALKILKVNSKPELIPPCVRLVMLLPRI